MQGNNQGNMLEPLADTIIGTTKLVAKLIPKVWDAWGNLMYWMIEGKSYKDIEGADNINITENIRKYEYEPIQSVNNIKKVNGKIVYEYIEGEKEGLKFCLGVDDLGGKVYVDMLDGNLLIAGMTGSGKGNIINVLVASIAITYTVNEVQIWGCDVTESDIYYFRRYKHFPCGIGITCNDFLIQVNELDKIMKKRAKLLDASNCKNIASYNSKHDKKETYILFIIDEITLLTDDNSCKKALHNLLSRCRKFGIFCVLCGQDATKDTIGKCKMNCPQTIGLMTYDETDSNTIMGKDQGLNNLVVGECKFKSKGVIKKVNVFYMEEEQIEDYLKRFKKEV